MDDQKVVINYDISKQVAAPDEYLSETQPDVEWMRQNGKKFWIQPIED